jgi:hypothetical protein
MEFSHPLIRTIRCVCRGNVALYEAMIASFKQELFETLSCGETRVNEASLDRFLAELLEEEEFFYDVPQTVKAMKGTDPELIAKIFAGHPLPRGRSSRKSK